MDETDLIIKIQSYLSSQLSAPIRARGMDDERPVPVIIIDNWNTKDLSHNNSAKAGEALGDFNGDESKIHEWYLNFSFKTRVEFLIRHSDEVDVSRLKNNLKQEIRLIRENPQKFDSEIKSCSLGRGGEPRSEFTEPKEAELMFSATFRGDHTITRTPSDTQYGTLQDVEKDFTFNP
jgi:hypothetical protein